jgi:hypothetical protein
MLFDEEVEVADRVLPSDDTVSVAEPLPYDAPGKTTCGYDEALTELT